MSPLTISANNSWKKIFRGQTNAFFPLQHKVVEQCVCANCDGIVSR